jgi:hypothetical protein
MVRHSGARTLEQGDGILKIKAHSNAFQNLQGGFMHPAALFIRQARKTKTLLTAIFCPGIRHGTLL